jgi:hypothetical protein
MLLNEYENILLENGVLTRLNKSFENNTLVNKPPAPPVIMKEAKSDETSRPEHLSVALQEFANNDPILNSGKCPKEKELNPRTKRCVKKCKPGFLRNIEFKCRKKTRKISKTNSKTNSKTKTKTNSKTNSKIKYR